MPRRLRPILHDALTIISLAIFAITAVLWIRSYWRSDAYQYRDDTPSCNV